MASWIIVRVNQPIHRHRYRDSKYAPPTPSYICLLPSIQRVDQTTPHTPTLHISYISCVFHLKNNDIFKFKFKFKIKVDTIVTVKDSDGNVVCISDAIPMDMKLEVEAIDRRVGHDKGGYVGAIGKLLGFQASKEREHRRQENFRGTVHLHQFKN
jgi:hypothetical protein